jgi:beta-xylosidase
MGICKPQAAPSGCSGRSNCVPKRLLTILAALGLAAPTPAAAQPPFVPVFETNFPDPFILPHGGEFLAYATNPEGAAANVPMARSTDLVNWELVRTAGQLHDAMPNLPPWAKEGWTWAPEVIRHGDRYLLYFTAKEKKSELQCVGVAEASDPRGPFTSAATEPLICQREIGGTIDPHAFRDRDGQLYLYYKNDGNHPNFRKPTDIFAQRLSADGLSLTGAPVALLRNDKGWEAHVIESPTMTRHGERYVMFFSANHFGWEDHQRLSPYAMGYARCEGPMGPCVDAPDNPILYSYNNREAGCLSGPGHQALFEAGGREFIVFHAHAARGGCRDANKGRYMYVAPLLWQNGEPKIGVSLRPRPPAGERG